MKGIAVVYQSSYGATKEYAGLIAKSMQCDIYKANDVNVESLEKYNTIIFGGGLYAGKIAGFKLIKDNWNAFKSKRVIVFIVGLTDPKNTSYYMEAWGNNFTKEMEGKVEVHFLRGSYNHNNLSLKHKLLMSMFKSMLKGKKDKTEEEKQMISALENNINMIDEVSIKPILDSLK